MQADGFKKIHHLSIYVINLLVLVILLINLIQQKKSHKILIRSLIVVKINYALMLQTLQQLTIIVMHTIILTNINVLFLLFQVKVNQLSEDVKKQLIEIIILIMNNVKLISMVIHANGKEPTVLINLVKLVQLIIVMIINIELTQIINVWYHYLSKDVQMYQLLVRQLTQKQFYYNYFSNQISQKYIQILTISQ
ncbi:unnamed protein product [Paramecium sonneborni]|uniref:Transmembrane protein n=1 Tax=Paramecium sonneborni TaxID=65129 RepID=A0A8S1RQS6_9CILI|nr:unnamed protein product [Paramecium sonneborni]